MNSLPGEQILLQSDNQNLVLTSHRVRYSMQTTGFSKVTSIMLEEITACEVTTTSKPWLLWAAALIFLAAVFANASNARLSNDAATMFAGGVVALLFVAAYFGTRQRVISLRSAGAAINVPTRSMSSENATAFIDTVESAKNARSFGVGRSTAASV